MIWNFCRMYWNNSKFYTQTLFLFQWMIFLYQKKKSLNIEFWVVLTHAGKIWGHLIVNWPSYLITKLISLILKHSVLSEIIIIMSCRQHGYPWPSRATSPYHSSLLAGLQGYIPYPHIAAVCMFELVVLLLLDHMRGSMGVHHWWVRPCFSSIVLHVWFV